jgi:hypothetical protein
LADPTDHRRRAHGLLAAAYERLGRHEEASTALAKFRELRPTTAQRNMFTPPGVGSADYQEAIEKLKLTLGQIGLPE